MQSKSNGMVNGILYMTQFDRTLDDETVDRIAQHLIERPVLDLTREEEYTAIVAALRTEEPLTGRIPQPHDEAAVRDFLERLVRRLDALRPWPEPPFTPRHGHSATDRADPCHRPVADLWSAVGYVATAERIVDPAGNVLAQRERRSGIRALVVSKTIVDATGRPLLKVLCRTGQVVARVDVLTAEDEPVAHIRGRAFFGRPRRFTVHDGSGSVIGRIAGTWFGREIVLLDNDGRPRVRGVRTGRKEGAEWAAEVQDGQPLPSPWPELTAGFFLSRRALEAAKPPS